MRILLLLLGMVGLTLAAQADYLDNTRIAKESSIDLSQQWEYRWGDSPFTADGRPLWTLEDNPAAWAPIDFPSNPPNRDGQTNAWYRLTLPDNQWRDPALYIFSIDLIAEFYLEDELIYRFGDFDASGQGRFIGWPWHIVLLPDDFAGKTLYARVYSDYPDIGLWGEVSLGPHIGHLQRMVKDDAGTLFISALLLLVTMFSLIFWFANRRLKANLYLSLFALCMAFVVLRQTELRLLLAYTPLTWEFLGGMAYFAIPLALAGYMEQVFNHARRWMRYLRWSLSAAVVIAFSLAILDIISIANLYPAFDIILLVSLLFIAAHLAFAVILQQTGARLVLTGMLILGGFYVYDMATAHGFLPWDRQRAEWGALIFVILLAIQAFRMFVGLQGQLLELTSELERKVTARTLELARRNDELFHANQQLHNLATTDPLTGLHNRRYFFDSASVEIKRTLRSQAPLALLVMDADNFKRINDNFGHAAGDAVLREATQICRSVVRDTDIFGRIGGEEFALCLPGTDIQGAVELAERLLVALRDSPIYFHDQEINFTMSIGVAMFEPTDRDVDSVYQRADAAMYDAKHQGRNRVAKR
ncbi:diguanylate cyclase [Salinispirillum marinum]|uniref:diguanylate cyclase n=2 Tax=Saccharospirillaceae TaxID=255527 RepID=A0ABV8BGI5_9GAMM